MTITNKLLRCLTSAALLGSTLALVPQTSGASSAPKPRVVVAVIDTGINPYHEFFHAGGPGPYKDSRPNAVTPAVLREFGIGRSNIVELTRTGNFASDFGRDRKEFEKIDKGEPYWFKGTNIIGISFEDGEPLRPDGTASPHGIGTAASVLAANPDAVVVAVEGMGVGAAEKWAFTHPAVDIVSTSYGPVTSYPTLTNLSHSYKGVVGNGKVHFGAAANDPSGAPLDETAGPWWTIGIAGFEEGDSNGRQMLSGNAPDFIGDFTQNLPYCRSCESGTRDVSGTSFATPRSAGTFSKILLTLRRAAGHSGGIETVAGKKLLVAGSRDLTVWKMRRALEEAAYYPTTGDYGQTVDPTAVPVNDQAPWVQAGWGLISPADKYRVVKETLAHLGSGGKPKRKKSQAACDYMTANMEARRAYWDQIAVQSESFGASKNPYIYC